MPSAPRCWDKAVTLSTIVAVRDPNVDCVVDESLIANVYEDDDTDDDDIWSII